MNAERNAYVDRQKNLRLTLLLLWVLPGVVYALVGFPRESMPALSLVLTFLYGLGPIFFLIWLVLGIVHLARK